jgi:hypothetical protein
MERVVVVEIHNNMIQEASSSQIYTYYLGRLLSLLTHSFHDCF